MRRPGLSGARVGPLVPRVRRVALAVPALLIPAALAAQSVIPGAGEPVRLASRLHEGLDSVVVRSMEANRIPGAALVLVLDGEIALTRAYGFADLDRRTPVTVERTLFRIGSVSKALTALALIRAADRGVLDLEAPVRRYLPDGFLPADRFDEPIRVRHLLSHSAGFDQVGLRRQVDDPELRPSLESFLRRELRPIRPPGVVGVYDTYGITLAGHLLERVSGRGYAEHMRLELFEPLGMHRTFVEAPDSLRADLAVGYGIEDGELVAQTYEHYVTTPASSIDATVRDMGELILAILGRDVGSRGRFLSDTMAARLRTVPQLEYGPDMGAFAWGFWEDRRDGHRALHHGGIMRGYSSELYLVPDARVGLFIAYNRDPETGPPPRLREDVIEFLYSDVLPAVRASWDPGGASTGSGESAVPPTDPLPVSADRFAGAYANTVGCFTCEEGQGWGLNTIRFESPAPGVLAMGDRRWLATGEALFRGEVSGAALRFLTDASGRVRYMVQGPNSFAKLDDALLDEVLGPGWRGRPPGPLVALAHRANGRWAEAAEAYGSLAGRHPANGRYAFYEGFSALNGGDPERAEEAFGRALAAEQWPAWSRYYIGCAWAALGRKEAALETLEQAIGAGFSDAHLLRSESCWDGLRGDRRFRELAARLDG